MSSPASPTKSAKSSSTASTPTKTMSEAAAAGGRDEGRSGSTRWPKTSSYQKQAASLMSSTVSSVSAAVGHLSRQPTLESAWASGRAFLDDAAAAATAGPDDYSLDGGEVDSLLHQKLYESNLVLCSHFENVVTESLDKVPLQLRSNMRTLNATQINLQETVLALQESSQNSDKILVALDELTATTDNIKFPV